MDKSSKKVFIITLILTFVLGWIAQGFAILAKYKWPTLSEPLLMVSMFMPMLALLIARRTFAGLGWKVELKGKWRYWLGACYLPALISLLGALLFFLCFPAAFDTNAGYLTKELSAQQVDLMKILTDKGLTPIGYFFISLAQTLTVVPFINAIPALGEEVAWRGYIYPYLNNKLGTVKSLVLGGTLWGIWHWPIIILIGYEYGENYFGSPWAGPPLFCLSTILMGALLAYFRLKTGSILAPALFHGATNAAGALPLLLLGADYGEYMILGPAQIGIISMIPMLIIVLWLFYREKKQENPPLALADTADKI